jgi:signal transduction histidine kinase
MEKLRKIIDMNMFRHFWARTGFLFGGFFPALALFVVAVTLFCTAAGTAVIYIGVPLGALTLLICKWYGIFCRGWLRKAGFSTSADGADEIAELTSGYEHHRSGFRKVLGIYAQPARWRELLFTVVDFPVAIFTWSIIVTWWAVILNGLTYWFWERFLADPSVSMCFRNCYFGGDALGLAEVMHLPFSDAWLYFIFAVIALLTLIPLTSGLTAMHAGLARAFLTPTKREKLKARIAEVEQSRERATSAQTKDLQQIERDLHDGPQQKLVRLGMDLATAQRRLNEGDGDGTAQLLAEARGRVDETLAEIRQISRTVAPPILSELGLAAAIESLAATSPIPGVVDAQRVEVGEAQATAIYFAVSEALANAAKYSAAKHITVKLGMLDGGVAVVATVRDDGRGGAVIVPGHGLAGLRDRLSGVDGTLEVMSATGEGTLVRVIVPVK